MGLPHIDYRHWLRVPGSAGKKGWHGAHTPKRVVLHDTEGHDAAGIADITNVCHFWDRQNLGYGAHFLVDKDGNVGCYVPVNQIAWHTAHHNTGSIGIEIIGFAKWTKAFWLTRKKQLDAVARIIAWAHTQFGVELRQDLFFGVLTHHQASRAFGGSHWDPGPGFPLTYVMYKARQIVKKESGG